MNELNGNGAFADAGSHALNGAVADIADCEDSGDIGFQQRGIAQVVTEEFPNVPGLESTQTLTAFRTYSKQDLEQAWDIGVE